MAFLMPHQESVLNRMKNGCILCGDVGSGKSRTAIAYYFTKECGGECIDRYSPMTKPKDLYIITTAQKRDKLEWEGELTPFLLSTNQEINYYGKDISVVVDSWNNIKKYSKVYGAFFIFDEQRVIGSGAWVKAFLDISRKNHWILLSATPGDKWLDYIPVFVANGFYKNRTEFKRRHVVYNSYCKYRVDRYIEEGRLNRLRNQVLVKMDDCRTTIRHYKIVSVEYDKKILKQVMTDRWNPYKEQPITNAAEYGYVLRKVVNSDKSRANAIRLLCKDHPKVIIFYNFDYELDILKNIEYEGEVAEWNGHLHQSIPKADRWIYLVQYSAGCEGWNCIETDTIIFYSLNHSYRITHQASGRIDRLNTPFTDLYYYQLKSSSWIDIAIARSLAQKRDFNIKAYY